MRYTETLEENWYSMQRVHFDTGGFIDIVHCDSINNPNNPKRAGIQLNAFATYVRLNGKGLWENARTQRRGIIKAFIEEQYTDAIQIWNDYESTRS